MQLVLINFWHFFIFYDLWWVNESKSLNVSIFDLCFQFLKFGRYLSTVQEPKCFWNERHKKIGGASIESNRSYEFTFNETQIRIEILFNLKLIHRSYIFVSVLEMDLNKIILHFNIAKHSRFLRWTKPKCEQRTGSILEYPTIWHLTVRIEMSSINMAATRGCRQ